MIFGNGRYKIKVMNISVISVIWLILGIYSFGIFHQVLSVLHYQVDRWLTGSLYGRSIYS